jgi:hypothetical protein
MFHGLIIIEHDDMRVSLTFGSRDELEIESLDHVFN